MRIRLPANGWTPRAYQIPLFNYLENGGKRAIAVWHRRSGKDEVALNWEAIAAFQRPATYWHMLPEAAQARKAIWEAVNPHTGKRRIDEAFPHEIRETSRDQDMMIRFKSGSAWHVVGSDNFNSLVGSPPAGVVFSEWALADPAAWAFLRPILAENGGWALFITTPRGNNHAKTMLDAARAEGSGWYADILPATKTDVFSPEALAVEKREYESQFGREQGLALYEQEYLCSFDAAVLGAFYAEELRLAKEQGRITKVPIDRTIPVHTSWDLGFTDATAIWFIQVVGRECRMVDYHFEAGAGLDHYARVLDEKKAKYGWRYLNGAEHWFPHDLAHHELTSGVSRAETMRSMGIEPTIVPQSNVMDGINAVRRLLSRSIMDEERCAAGISALQAYRRDWDESNKVFRPKPLHNWASHGADALRTFATGFGDSAAPREERAYQRKRKASGTSWMAA